MTEYHCQFTIGRFTIYDLFGCFFQREGIMCLLDSIDIITLLKEVSYRLFCLLIVRPTDCIFSAEGCLVQLLIRRAATYTTKHDTLNAHRICCAKNSTYIMLAAHIIEYYNQRQFVCVVVFLYGHSPHLGSSEFFHI